MTWQTCAPHGREASPRVPPIVHGGKIIWLWSDDEGGSLAYDPVADRWSPFATPFGTGVRAGAMLASIAGELIVFSGQAQSYWGSRYSKPVSGGTRLRADGTWQPMATKHQPAARNHARHGFTGKELLVWGGGKPTGGRYDPAADTWRRIATKDGPALGIGDWVFTGTELWTWGGARYSRSSGLTKAAGGFAYEVAADAWRPLAKLPGKPDDLFNRRSLVRIGDAALLVRADEGSDVGTCSAWRYEPRADLWEPCTPPPEVTRNDPDFIACGDRIVCVMGRELFEYLVTRDVWAPLPAAPEALGWDPKYVWSGEALYAIGDVVARLALPAIDELVVASTASFAPTSVAAPRPTFQRGAPVTALALRDGIVLSGHADGTVRRSDAVVRKTDNKRIYGLAIHDATWVCLAGGVLEVRAWPDGAKPTKVKLPIDDGYELAHHGATIVIAGASGLVPVTYAKTKWTAGALVKTTGTTSAIGLAATGLARVVLGRERRKGERTAPTDTVERRDASLKKVLGTFSVGIERGTTSALPIDNGVLIAGGGSYHAYRCLVGKKRPSSKLHTDCAWSSPVVRSADDRWLLFRHAGRGAELYDLADERRELLWHPFDDDEDDDLRPELEALYPPPPFLAEEDAAKFLEATRCGGPTSAIAISPDGAHVALGTTIGATFVIERDTLGITLVPGAGPAIEWQPSRAEVVGRHRPFALGHDLARAVVYLVRTDGTFGELAAATGEWTWGATLERESLEQLRQYDWQVLGVERRGTYVIVHDGTERRGVFDHGSGKLVATPPADPERRPHHVVHNDPEPHLVAIDALTREVTPVCGAPESPDHATIELGAGRHYVIVGEGDNAIIHTRTAKVERVAFLPRASLDGTHFTVPEGPDGPYRRWRIYGADTTPIASFESNHKLDHLAVLPNGRRIGWTRDLLVLFAADGTQRFAARGFGKDLAAVCPSADGEHVITYDTDGTFRRWAT